jgi:hypothetical protein
MLKFIFGRILAFIVFFMVAGSQVENPNSEICVQAHLIWGAIGMCAQYILYLILVLVTKIASTWFGIEFFNENRFVRTFGATLLSYAVVFIFLGGANVNAIVK